MCACANSWQIVTDLKVLEEEAVKLEGKIDRIADEKKQMLAELVEAERQIMLWERKTALEKELQEALDPNIGGDIVASMKKEIHRMELRLRELQKRCEELVVEMEKSISRRDVISVQSQVERSKKEAKKDVAISDAALKKACLELKRSIH